MRKPDYPLNKILAHRSSETAKRDSVVPFVSLLSFYTKKRTSAVPNATRLELVKGERGARGEGAL